MEGARAFTSRTTVCQCYVRTWLRTRESVNFSTYCSRVCQHELERGEGSFEVTKTRAEPRTLRSSSRWRLHVRLTSSRQCVFLQRSMATFDSVVAVFEDFRRACNAKPCDVDACTALLTKVKVAILSVLYYAAQCRCRSVTLYRMKGGHHIFRVIPARHRQRDVAGD